MKSIVKNISTILLLLFEGILGIMLFRDPTSFTQKVIVIFGIVMLTLGVLDLLRAFRCKNDGKPDPFLLTGAVVDLIIGLLCTVGSGIIMGLFPVLAAFYGVVLIITGIYKLRIYFSFRRSGYQPAVISLLSAIAVLVLGIVVLLHPFSTTTTVWRSVGAILIAEALLDAAAFFLSITKKSR